MKTETTPEMVPLYRARIFIIVVAFAGLISGGAMMNSVWTSKFNTECKSDEHFGTNGFWHVNKDGEWHLYQETP